MITGSKIDIKLFVAEQINDEIIGNENQMLAIEKAIEDWKSIDGNPRELEMDLIEYKKENVNLRLKLSAKLAEVLGGLA